MDSFKFIHFQKNMDDKQQHCDMIVYVNSDDHYYFFGNALFHCLGYERPHKELIQQIPKKDWTKESKGHGIYLHETIVQQVIQRKVAQDIGFQNFYYWFNDYLASCRGKSTPSLCPQPISLDLL